MNKKTDTRKNIIDAAIKCFGRKGIENTKLIEIAEEAGIKHSLILYHFKDFDELCLNVVDDIVNEFYQAGRNFLPQKTSDPIDFLISFVVSHFIIAKKNKNRFSIWLHLYYKASQDERYAQKLKMIRLNSSEKIQTLLLQYYTQNDAKLSQEILERDVMFILSILSGNIFLAMTDDSSSFDHYIKLSKEMIKNYLRTNPA
jgi:AcrR family transcriptional regulator